MSDDQPTGHPSAHAPRQTPNKPPSPGDKGPFSATYPDEADLPDDDVCYGPDIATEAELRLIGDLDGKRVLVLGSGGGQAAIAMARRGAHVIAVDRTAANLARVRRAADEVELKVEVHHSDLADLAFLRADSVDAAYSAYALATVDDLGRAFRQIHRVLRPDQNLVLSLPHPVFATIEPGSNDPMRVRRTYWDATPRSWDLGDRSGEDHPHTISAVFTHLVRSNFRVDTLLEPEPDDTGRHSAYYSEIMRWLPATLLIKAKKLGS